MQFAQLDGDEKPVDAEACFSEELLRPPCGSPATRYQAVKPHKFGARPHHRVHSLARILLAGESCMGGHSLNEVDVITCRPAETESTVMAASHRPPSSATGPLEASCFARVDNGRGC